MEYTEKEIQTFVMEQLKEHGEWLTRRFREALEKNKNRETGTLIGSMQGKGFSVKPEADGATLAIDILEYGRLMEIGGRRRRIAARNHDVWGKKNRAKGKKTLWYNKNRYGGYGYLVRSLSAGMSDAELQRIRGIIEEQKQKFVTNGMR